jgi:hypothetical protein
LAAARLGIATETIALFIRFWLLVTPQLPDQTQPAIGAKGIERYERFVAALGKRLSKGPSFLREVSRDVEPAGYYRPRSEQDDAPSRS